MYFAFRTLLDNIVAKYRDDAKIQVNKQSQAVHAGYISKSAADAAFEYAQQRGWTRSTLQPSSGLAGVSPSSTTPQMPVPISLEKMGLSERYDNPINNEQTSRWYTVYRGLRPGVYRSL